MSQIHEEFPRTCLISHSNVDKINANLINSVFEALQLFNQRMLTQSEYMVMCLLNFKKNSYEVKPFNIETTSRWNAEAARSVRLKILEEHPRYVGLSF